MHRASVWIPLLLLSSSIAAVPRSVRDGVYTRQQAARGLSTYREECLCHAENLMGGEAAPALAGDEFLKKWNRKTVGDLFELVRQTMPTDDPGNLSRRQYADLVAYVLSANDFPAGQKDLESDTASLKGIRIEAKQ